MHLEVLSRRPEGPERGPPLLFVPKAVSVSSICCSEMPSWLIATGSGVKRKVRTWPPIG